MDSASNVPAFITKLWKLVEDPNYDHLIQWNQVCIANKSMPLLCHYLDKHSKLAICLSSVAQSLDSNEQTNRVEAGRQSSLTTDPIGSCSSTVSLSLRGSCELNRHTMARGHTRTT